VKDWKVRRGSFCVSHLQRLPRLPRSRIVVAIVFIHSDR
jgi:hypothetical protein